MDEWLVGQWIVGVISFQKIFGLYGLKGHIVEKRQDVTLVNDRRTTECENIARILFTEFAIFGVTHNPLPTSSTFNLISVSPQRTTFAPVPATPVSLQSCTYSSYLQASFLASVQVIVSGPQPSVWSMSRLTPGHPVLSSQQTLHSILPVLLIKRS